MLLDGLLAFGVQSAFLSVVLLLRGCKNTVGRFIWIQAVKCGPYQADDDTTMKSINKLRTNTAIHSIVTTPNCAKLSAFEVDRPTPTKTQGPKRKRKTQVLFQTVTTSYLKRSFKTQSTHMRNTHNAKRATRKRNITERAGPAHKRSKRNRRAR